MFKLITTVLFSFILNIAFAQNDLLDRLEKQAVHIDSLKKSNSILKDSEKKLMNELINLEELKKGKKSFDSILHQKNDSIRFLKFATSENDNQIARLKQRIEQNAKEEYEKGKTEVFITIGNRYRNKPFDELLKAATKQSIVFDLEVFQTTTDIKTVILDIQKYFNAKQLLNYQLDLSKIKECKLQLNQIKQKSLLVMDLVEVITNYQGIDEGLKETVGKIIDLDKKESVLGLSKEVQVKKFYKILAELTSFIFNYDFKVHDYPFLSDILFDIIKRKKPNPDADISDLLTKL